MYCPRIWPRANFLKKVKDQKVEANSSSSSASKIILIVVIISVLYIYLTIFSFFETIIIIEYDFLRLFLLVCASLISHAVADNIISNIMQILFVSKQQLLCLYGSQAWINIIICFFSLVQETWLKLFVTGPTYDLDCIIRCLNSTMISTLRTRLITSLHRNLSRWNLSKVS